MNKSIAMDNPKKTLENLTKYTKNPDFARHSLDMEKTDSLQGIKDGTDKVAEAIKAIPKTEFPESIKVELTGNKKDKVAALLEALSGEDGHTPTKQELEEIIKPLIPEPIEGKPGVDGRTPIKDIDYRDGKDAEPLDEQKIIEAILKKIPKPKNGKDGVSPEPLKPEVIVKETIKHLTSLKGNDRPSLKMFRESDDLIGTVSLHKNMMSRMPKSLLDGDQRWHGGGSGGGGTWTSGSFTPDGITTVFTLPSIPASILFLFDNGQLQLTPSDYSLSGAIVTFVTAPLVSDLVTYNFQ